MDLLFKISICVTCLLLYTDFTQGQKQQDRECRGSGGAYAWLSCLLANTNKKCNVKTCARYAGTQYEKDLTCSYTKLKCGGCVTKYRLNGTDVSCNALQQTGYDCEPGVEKVKCLLDPCLDTQCKSYLTAPCRQNFCGGCYAEYDVDGMWRRCPEEISSIQPDGQVLRASASRAILSDGVFSEAEARFGIGLDGPIPAGAPAMSPEERFQQAPKSRKSNPIRPIEAPQCPDGLEAHPNCPADICTTAQCNAYPQAKCRINNCGGCFPEFTTGIYVIQDCNSRVCPKNTLEMVCKDDPCKYSTCKKFADKNPVCRPSRCGGCKAQWFVDGKEVDCFKQYGKEVPCPNGEKPEKCPKRVCRFKHCPLDRTITCTINNCGGCYREYHQKNADGSVSVVDESACLGWWSKDKFRNKKKKFIAPKDGVLSPNEIDPMARRNNLRTVNSLEKPVADIPPPSLVQKVEIVPSQKDLAFVDPKNIPNSPPVIEDTRFSEPIVMDPVSRNPEIEIQPIISDSPVNPFIENPIIRDQGTINNRGKPDKVKVNLHKEQPINEISDPVIVTGSHTDTLPVHTDKGHVLEKPKSSKVLPDGKVVSDLRLLELPPLETIAKESVQKGKAKISDFVPPKINTGLDVDRSGKPLVSAQPIPGSELPSKLSIEIIDVPKHKQHLVRKPRKHSRRTKKRLNKKNKKANKANKAPPKKIKKPKTSSFNFWKTDMQLPLTFFEYMLQGLGLHGIPSEGLVNKRN